jgi:hypothetical protein
LPLTQTRSNDRTFLSNKETNHNSLIFSPLSS